MKESVGEQMNKLSLMVLAGIVGVLQAPFAYALEAQCVVEVTDLKGNVLKSASHRVSLLQHPASAGTVHSATFPLPIDPFFAVISVKDDQVAFTSNIEIRKTSGQVHDYTQQDDGPVLSTQGYRAPGYVAYGQSRAHHFSSSTLLGHVFFQENSLHQGETVGDGGPVCYPTCPPSGPYDFPATGSLPKTGQVNLSCEVVAIP
jgi:hypothetical protein